MPGVTVLVLDAAGFVMFCSQRLCALVYPGGVELLQSVFMTCSLSLLHWLRCVSTRALGGATASFSFFFRLWPVLPRPSMVMRTLSVPLPWHSLVVKLRTRVC